MKASDLVKQAFNEGVKGFKDGLISAPYGNEKFINSLPYHFDHKGKVNNTRLRMLFAYAKGWASENLKAPC